MSSGPTLSTDPQASHVHGCWTLDLMMFIYCLLSDLERVAGLKPAISTLGR